MENKKENTFVINPAPGTNEIVIRHGDAVPVKAPKDPNILSYSGDIHSISNFLSKRESGYSSQSVDKNKVVVIADKTNFTITMQLDPENYWGATITGKLEISNELKWFGIFTGTGDYKKYSRKSLTETIRFSKHFFADADEHGKLVAALSSVKVKTQQQMEQSKNQRGNSNDIRSQDVEAPGLPENFTVMLPIFKGFAPEKISVDICFDVVNNDVAFWLESASLRGLIDQKIDSIFETELESCTDFVIIEK